MVEKPEEGYLLLNHWQQKVVVITDYDPTRGAKGYELSQSTKGTPVSLINWPPLALETEIKQNRWVIVEASDNITNGTVLELLPSEMPKALWELLFLLLVSKEKEPEVLQALLDTGLSPRRGLISYLRLLEKVMLRVEMVDSIPEYRQIVEQEIRL